MTVLARSLLEQSEFFLHILAKAEWYLNIPQKMKTSLCLHFSFVIILYYKSHVLLWSKMHKAFVNTIFVHIFSKMVVELYRNNLFLHICKVIFFIIWWLHSTLNIHLSFWTPLPWPEVPWPEGSYWIGDILLTILCCSFLGTGSLVFSESLYGLKGPYGDVCDSARFFFGKIPLQQKCQKWSKNGVLDFSGKSIRLFCLEMV